MSSPELPGPIGLNPLAHEKALYFGSDRRINVTETENGSLHVKSVACLMSFGQLLLDGSDRVFSPRVLSLSKWIENRYQSKYSGEYFKKEPVAGCGTAFLVGARHMLTAAHCVCRKNTDKLDKKKIENTYVVFDFIGSKAFSDYQFSKQQIYTIHKVVDYVKRQNNVDWAIIELDREVEGRPPLPIEWTTELAGQTPVYMLGHPTGLPMKYVEGRSKEPNQPSQPDNETREFHIDAFEGNSGSPVFKSDTHTVVGMLVSGEPDYDVDNGKIRLHNAGNADSEKCQAFLPGTRLHQRMTLLCSQDAQERCQAAHALGSSILLEEENYPDKILKAAKLFEQAFNLGQNLEAGYNQAYCLYHLDQKKQALTLFSQLSAMQPSEKIQQATNAYVQILNEQGYAVNRGNVVDPKAALRTVAAPGGHAEGNDNEARGEGQILTVARKDGVSLSEGNQVEGRLLTESGAQDTRIDTLLEDFEDKKNNPTKN